MTLVTQTPPTQAVHEPSPQPLIALSAVEMRYGAVQALAGIDLEVREGEIVSILGPNGAGKSTAISLMLGLRRPTAGAVRIFGREPGDPAIRSRIGAMLQESGVPATLRVGELVDLFRSYYPYALPAAAILAAADLEELARRPAGKLSGGQRQRLYFALALAGDPDLLFLDEPTAGMDVAARQAFWSRIRAFAALGKTILFTTHLLEEADAMASRIVVIDRGRVVAEGTPAEIKARTIGKRVRVRGSVTEAVLGAMPGVRSVTRDGAYLVAAVDDSMPVLRQLLAMGSAVEELTVEETSLEAAFLGLTGDDSTPPTDPRLAEVTR
jgi:ABC-2 type transport system ATP-binding protein